MTTISNDAHPSPRAAGPLIAAIAALLAEFVLIGALFKHAVPFECRQTWPVPLCDALSLGLVLIICGLGAVIVYLVLRPSILNGALADIGGRSWPIAVNLAGVGVAAAPALSASSGALGIPTTFAFWAVGSVAMCVGWAAWIGPRSRWRALAVDHGWALGAAFLTGAVTPALALQLQPVWQIEAITDFTFRSVAMLLHAVGYDPIVDPVGKGIGTYDFFIRVEEACSGVEGMALVTIFVALYLLLFRRELAFPAVLLIFPIGLIASTAFNIVRITLLLVIGIEIDHDLAIETFHSHAGWMMFSLVAIGVVFAARAVPAFQKAGGADGPAATTPPTPFRDDPEVARILPFAVFMLSAVIGSALADPAGLAYPFRVAAMVAAVAIVWPALGRIEWKAAWSAPAIGAAVGLLWIAVPSTASGTAPYGALTGAALLAWFVLRGVGTILLVPLIEEAFFRDYLERKLQRGPGWAWTALSVAVATAAFAALHDKWMLAAVAALAFSYVRRSTGRLSDAVVAHAVANAVVFGVAMATGNLGLI